MEDSNGEVSIFVTFANSFHPTINFTCELSSKRTVFLDADVFKLPRLSALKPGSHLSDKHNASEISISTRKKEYVSFFLCLCLCLFLLCCTYCTSVNQALEFSIHKPISSPLKLFSIHTSHSATHSLRKRILSKEKHYVF